MLLLLLQSQFFPTEFEGQLDSLCFLHDLIATSNNQRTPKLPPLEQLDMLIVKVTSSKVLSNYDCDGEYYESSTYEYGTGTLF